MRAGDGDAAPSGHDRGERDRPRQHPQARGRAPPASSGLSSRMAVETTTVSAPPRCSSACPTSTRAPSARSASSVGVSRRSLPDTGTPRASRMRAMPLIPAPPMPTKCTAPSSAGEGTGPVQAATSAALIVPVPVATSRTMSASRSSASGAPAAAACRAYPASASGSVSSGTTCSAIHAGVRSASSTSSPPPASTTGRALRRCSPLPMGSGHEDARQADGGELGHGHRPGPAQGEVGGGVGEVHALEVVDHHVGRRAGRGARGLDVGVLRAARVQHLDARPRDSASAAPTAARFSVAAPCEPPKTSSVGRSASRPKAVRASARSAGRSSELIAVRSGMPTCSPRCSGVPGVVTATRAASRAPIRLASPGSAFCSCTTIGTPARRAAR